MIPGRKQLVKAITLPDFYCLNLRTRREFVLEHFGMMDDLDYVESVVRKTELYQESGISTFNGLIVTMETRKHPLSTVVIEKMIKKYLIIFFISMVPLVELRGAIPFSQGFGLPIIQSYIICIIGNMLPVPIIYLFARKVLEWGADKPVIGKFFTWCLDKGHKGGKKLQEKAGKGLFVALLLFVGIPVPGTGAWTGTLAASILDMDFKSTVAAVMLGVLLAGVIMMVVSMAGFSLF